MPHSNAMPWRLVIAGCIGLFAATATGSTRAPFLPDMATDLNVSLPAIANLFGYTAATWGISSYLVGYASDRVGRRVFLIASPLLLAVAMLAASQAPSYLALVIIVIAASTCCGAFTSTAMAEVSIHTGANYQGRALGYVMSGQSLTLLFGVPAAAWLGAILGWRGMHVALAGLAVFAAFFMIFAQRSQPVEENYSAEEKRPRVSVRKTMTGVVVRLFIALAAERVAFGLAAFYYASYLRVEYGLQIAAVALPLAVFALGNILGTLIGGQVADRFRYRRVSFALSLIVAGAITVPWFSWQPGLQITISLGVLFAFFNALARPSLLAALAEVPAEVRGVVMGLNSSIASVGWLTAALAGGWLYSTVGFSGFSPLMALMCLISALVVLPDSRIRHTIPV